MQVEISLGLSARVGLSQGLNEDRTKCQDTYTVYMFLHVIILVNVVAVIFIPH